jgi:hypothetical protein
MCAPVALGVASAVASGAGAIGQHQSASAQANAQNAAATSNYKYQLKVRERNWDRTRYQYNTKLAQYKEGVNQNQLAAARAYSGEQNRLNEIYRKASFETQARLGKLVGNSGKAAAMNATGKSAERASNQINRMYGMNQAIQQESLNSARLAYGSRTDAIRNQLRSDNNKAYQNVAIQPMPGVAPPPPIMTPGPSPLGLIGGIASSAVSGYGTYQELKNYQPKDGLS